MHAARFTLALIPAVLVAAATPALADPPPVFSEAGFDADRAASIEQDKLHLVYATAVWCPPCQQMKKTTWVDGTVESWVESNAIVTALDVDDFPEKAGELRVRAMPTMILFEGEEELGRTVGYKSADSLLSWMEAGKAGELPEAGAADAKRGGADDDPVRAKLDAARDMVFDGRYDEATEAYVSLWETMLDEDEAYYGVRLSFMVGSMTDLVEQHEPARAAFRAIRDREAAELEAGNIDWETLTDWVHLNGVIGDYDATYAWVERLADRENSRGTLLRYADEIFQQAEAGGRWDIVRTAVPDPIASAQEAMRQFQMLETMTDMEPLSDPDMLGWSLTPAVVSALHAEDGGDSADDLIAYLDGAMPDHDAWRAAWISIADRCGKSDARFTAWIEEFELDEQFPESLRTETPGF